MLSLESEAKKYLSFLERSKLKAKAAHQASAKEVQSSQPNNE